MGIRISIEQVDNGFIFTSIDDQVGDAKTTVHETPRQVVRAMRKVLGLKTMGRPLKPGETVAFDPFADEDEA